MFERAKLAAIFRRPLVSFLVPPAAVALILAMAFFVPGASNIFGKLASCSAASLSAAPPTLPAGGGPTVVETASATCQVGYGYPYGAGTPKFRFWEQDPGVRWSMVQDFSQTNTHNWNTTGLKNGDYRLEVDVLSIDEPNSKGYDVVALITYHIGPAACTSPTLTAAPPSPTATGNTVTLTATAASCPSPRFRFWIRDPYVGARWSMVQDYGTQNTHSWPQTVYVGQYSLEVDVRDASETVAYDKVANIVYNTQGCSVAAITALPTTAPHNTTDVVLTATSTCPAGSQGAEYRFWIKDPGVRWSMVQNYSAINTYTWRKASIYKAGTYTLEVDVRNKGSVEIYEVVGNNTFAAT